MSSANLTRSLYRKALRIIATVVRANATKVAAARWAEFIPSCVNVDHGDDLAVIARKCFVTSANSPAVITNAFIFLKEASESVFSIEVRALWEKILYSEDCDLVSAIGLISASFEMVGTDLALTASVETRSKEFSTLIEQLIHKITITVMEEVDLKRNFRGTRKILEQVHKIIVKETNICRSDAEAKDYTALSLVNQSRCSEYILNVVLFTVLRNMGFACFLVGSGLHFRWIRVDLFDKGRNRSRVAKVLFVSWSYGVKKQKEVEALIGITNTQWFRRVPWDGEARKHVLCELLRKQLSSACGDTSDSATENARRSICKEQILILLM
ncbi:unnamed protein product [Phytomonas sp. EM1]|nr:unnamed protein product [Phytomonas sp. EM1]|eukprot:CCW65808.1 unnamed protein product [Phytomonas sp. isolate EM1]